MVRINVPSSSKTCCLRPEISVGVVPDINGKVKRKMKKIAAIIMLSMFAGTAMAKGSTVELLSMDAIKIGGTEVSLPKTRNAEGLICQSYIADSKRDAKGTLTIQIAEICGKPVKIESSGIGGAVYYPDTLLSMRFVRNGDLGKHVLSTRD